MRRIVAPYRSSVGKEILMAFPGFLWFGFLVGMLAQYDKEGFGTCTNHRACQEACPKGISVDFIACLNRDLPVASWKAAEPDVAAVGGAG